MESKQLTPGERKQMHMLAVLGSATGWEFVERRVLEVVAKSEATGARLRSGVQLKNEGLGTTIFMGEGEAEKYTDVIIPKVESTRKPRATRRHMTEEEIDKMVEGEPEVVGA